MTNIFKSLAQQPSSAAHRVIKNTGFLYVRMGITMFISLYSTRLILSALGASDFGIFNVVGGSIAMFGFLNDAMTNATQRFMSFAQGEGNKEKQKHVFNVSVVIHFLIAIVMTIVLLAAGYFFFNGFLNIPAERLPVARMVFYFMVASTVFGITTVPYNAVIYSHENMLFYTIVGIIESFLKLGVALAVAYTITDKLVLYGLLMTCIAFSLRIFKRMYCRKKYEECTFAPKTYFKRSIMKEMTGYAGWTLLGASTSMITNYGQNLVVNKFFGTTINAAQGIASQVNGILSVLSNTVLRALYPVIMKSEGAGDRIFMFKAINFGCKSLFLLMALPIIPVLIEMPYIFELWLGAGKVPEFAVVFCRLLLFKTLIDFLFIPCLIAIKAQGNIKKFEIVFSFFCFFPLIIAYFLFREGFPAYCIYVIFIIFAMINLVLVLYFAWKNVGFPIRPFLKNVLLRCFFAFTMILTISLIPVLLWTDSFYRLLAICAISGITFLLVSWFVGFKDDEKTQIKNLAMPYLLKIFPNKIQSIIKNKKTR